ncbi:MAG: chromosome segregation protein, partial [Mycobacterium sp.]|nr:chromosome segregation protein [Mycobacterium sp.]
ITHQKPTMEIADALYGVTMRDDGITTVISQRMRGQELVSAGRRSPRLRGRAKRSEPLVITCHRA